MASIISGNGNKIQPDFDAAIRELCFGTYKGQNLIYTSTTNGFFVEGYAFVFGFVSFFSGAKIELNGETNGFVYVDFTVYYDEDIKDETSVYFSSTPIERTDDISGGPGTYSFCVATITNGVFEKHFGISYPALSQVAEIAHVVDLYIESNATATTQETSDNTTKVATTEFVHNAIDSRIDDSTVSITNPSVTATQNIANYRFGAMVINLKCTANSPLVGDTVGTVSHPPTETIRDVGELFRNGSSVGSFVYEIDTNGNINIITSHYWREQEEFYINCGYLTS